MDLKGELRGLHVYMLGTKYLSDFVHYFRLSRKPLQDVHKEAGEAWAYSLNNDLGSSLG